MEYRRFGSTELQMPVITCGAMRFQHSWKGDDPVPEESQRNVDACVREAFDNGITHFETARGYGTSEVQLGKALQALPRDEVILQTKGAPRENVDGFVEDFEKSLVCLNVDYLDIFSFHDINNNAQLEAAKGCYDAVLKTARDSLAASGSPRSGS